jgi:protocatechuate 3,4-dioxygenase beta subunit
MDHPPTYQGRPLPHPDESVFDQGLAFDLATLIDRRRALKLMGAVTVGGLILASPLRVLAQSASTGTEASDTEACAVIEEETAGPYPGDGSSGPDVLALSGVVREDIRSSFDTASGVAEGVPLTVRFLLQDAANGCAAFAGGAVYAWHCDREGRYSMYSQGVTDQNWLRGVQGADEDGLVTFQSIFPGCYAGRWPHIHFEVYPSLDAATDDANKIATSQIALPEDSCRTVYATEGYESSASSLNGVSLRTDNVFGNDGGAHQLGSIEGDVDNGLTVTLAVPVLSS